MTPQPLVSIVTPCLGGAGFIDRCLASVAAQTFSAVEHIVVDGGSTDGTVEILARSNGVRWISEPDNGQSDAINKGFRLASGGLLTWLNADDQLVPEAVDAVVSVFAEDAEIGWVYGDCLIRSPEGESVRRGFPSVGPGSFDFGNVIPQPGCFVAHWALDRVGLLDETFELAMDYDLWLRLADARVPAAYVPRVLAVFDLSEGSKTSNATARDWGREEARALLKAGKPRAAAAIVGRWAAIDALPAGRLVSRRSLREAVRRGTLDAEGLLDRPSRIAVRAGAITEAALNGQAVSRRALLLLLSPFPWLVPSTRRRVLQQLRNAVRRRARLQGT